MTRIDTRPWRIGTSWSRKGGLTTLVLTGTGPPDDQGRRADDRLIGTMETPQLAELVVGAVNDGPAYQAIAELERLAADLHAWAGHAIRHSARETALREAANAATGRATELRQQMVAGQ